MATALIIGSGLASAGAALALSRTPDMTITILDIGLQLEAEHVEVVDRLARTDPSEWTEAAVRTIAARPVRSGSRALPEKRAYGSDFPFRDVGQLEGVSATDGTKAPLISGAYGGFSTVWGAQIMPFTAATFASWPIAMRDMHAHYGAVLDEIPFAAEEDDLARHFPMISSPEPLPGASARTTRVLAAYRRHRRRLNSMGVTIGKARLAFRSSECVRCGMCMTGCPYSLIYSASQTIDRLRRSGRLTYRSDLLAVDLHEDERSAVVTAKDIRTSEQHRFEADRVFVACGAVGTTRLVAGSLGLFDRDITLAESQQFTVPMLSRASVRNPLTDPQFTLNQFNMLVDLHDDGLDVSQLHIYTFDPAFRDALPWPLRTRPMHPLMLQVLRRLSVAIGYLPSWESPSLTVRLQPPAPDASMSDLRISRQEPSWRRNRMLRQVMSRVLRSGTYLDLYPLIPKLMLTAGGKSYHVGSSFPHAATPRTILSSDRLGRVGAWKRIHLVDASVFPNVPATTYGLTVMANAHRIASEALESHA